MKIKKNKSHDKLISSVVELFISHQPKLLKMLHNYFILDPEPIREADRFRECLKINYQ